jgi:hypothetical protein
MIDSASSVDATADTGVPLVFCPQSLLVARSKT